MVVFGHFIEEKLAAAGVAAGNMLTEVTATAIDVWSMLKELANEQAYWFAM